MAAIARLAERVDKLEEEVAELREQLGTTTPAEPAAKPPTRKPAKNAANTTRVGGKG